MPNCASATALDELEKLVKERLLKLETAVRRVPCVWPPCVNDEWIQGTDCVQKVTQLPDVRAWSVRFYVPDCVWQKKQPSHLVSDIAFIIQVRTHQGGEWSNASGLAQDGTMPFQSIVVWLFKTPWDDLVETTNVRIKVLTAHCP